MHLRQGPELSARGHLSLALAPGSPASISPRPPGSSSFPKIGWRSPTWRRPRELSVPQALPCQGGTDHRGMGLHTKLEPESWGEQHSRHGAPMAPSQEKLRFLLPSPLPLQARARSPVHCGGEDTESREEAGLGAEEELGLGYAEQ